MPPVEENSIAVALTVTEWNEILASCDRLSMPHNAHLKWKIRNALRGHVGLPPLPTQTDTDDLSHYMDACMQLRQRITELEAEIVRKDRMLLEKS